MQINLTGFLNGRNARSFMGELWDLLVSAQESVTGIPEAFLQQKKDQIKKRLVIINFYLYVIVYNRFIFIAMYIHILYPNSHSSLLSVPEFCKKNRVLFSCPMKFSAFSKKNGQLNCYILTFSKIQFYLTKWT